ncbi:porin [Billgrantia tianxiuensis]|uniref:Porin n=1 Tax=Billgrantia tianxiuensis TaxID=2497861 RepID=A0A6I6ST37_9GAMM|nr:MULTISPECIES: porin [Halomonas]MCE8034264.1 porin [Halomonas sp. MCCC 1A11057]QHC50927.1 porin [Halomonas tianxiuensis]
MKKTLLATAIAGALGASAAAQAATVYDQDGTQLIINGRIALGISGGGEDDVQPGEPKAGGTEFRNIYSRLGISMSHDISRDLRAFGRVEWRFNGDERDRSGGFTEVRHSYIGLESQPFGTVMAGNFDSFFNSHVMAPFDVYIDRGLEFSKGGAGGDLQARGDSIGYITPDLSGFQAFLMGKHYSGNDLAEIGEDRSSVINLQGGVKYQWEGLRLAVGFAQDRDDYALSGGENRNPAATTPSSRHRYNGSDLRGADENIYGATVSYAFNDQFSARLGYETQDSNDAALDAGGDIEQYSGYKTWGLGATYSLGQWAFNADVYRVRPDNEENRTAWAAGAYYKVSNNFDVFGELHRADQGDVTVGTRDGFDVEDNDDNLYWLVGARYHF